MKVHRISLGLSLGGLDWKSTRGIVSDYKFIYQDLGFRVLTVEGLGCSFGCRIWI